ncbi:PEP-CTERM sorting domain-containing protein [Aquabacterium sp.]|uniref:PEP-CTERM sorting domain-containing protein n=1 Tax=Aquabacterium sp. TaxID=1872578 RepID=UPI002489825A|nr:PEP-CTERM sorting domain-containing protein [Aquabacterium sp.]MDI1257660.1 PEP-CTERM sorting domain-containing protein [Aquabacterium sp.]
MLHPNARRLVIVGAILLAGLSSAHAEATPDTNSLSGIECSNGGLLTFTGGPQTSLKCSTILVMNSGSLQASESLLIQADEAIQILGDFALLAPHVSLTSKSVWITGKLTGLDTLYISTPEGGLGPFPGGGIIDPGVITIRDPATGTVPEPSAALLVLLGLLSVLGWKAHQRTLPVSAWYSITQSPMKL